MRPFLYICSVYSLIMLPFSVLGDNLILSENKWVACNYYDSDTQQVIHEGCEGSKIQIASCSGTTCYFQADFNHGSPWQSECIMWGKLNINSTDNARGTAIAEYRSRGMNDRKYEDCELEFNIDNNNLKINIMSGCDKYCTPDEFEFSNIYHIDNTGGAVTP